MNQGAEKTLQYKGYDVQVLDGRSIYVYRNGIFKMHINCNGVDSEEDIINAIDEILALEDREGNQY